MGTSNLRIGVVIVNYNAGEYLGYCIESLLQSRAPLDIVIVDNNSQDQSLDCVDKHDHKRHHVKVIRNSENVGFSCAVNQGFLATSSNYVALINPDCTVFPMTLLKLQQALIADASVGIAGALVFNPDGSEQRGCRRREPTFRRSMVTALRLSDRYEGVDMNNQPIPSRTTEVDAVSGAAMMIRREYFDELGGMDESYFLHCEDLDLCRRMRDFGYLVVFCPQASVFHRQGSSAGTTASIVEKHKHQGMLLYNAKHGDAHPLVGKFLMPGIVGAHFWLKRVKRLLGRGVKRLSKSDQLNWEENMDLAAQLPVDFSSLDLLRNKAPVVLITGCKSDVGTFLLNKLKKAQCKCIAVSRGNIPQRKENSAVRWLELDYFIKSPADDFGDIDCWINLAPLSTTKPLAQLLNKFNPKRIIALSSALVEIDVHSENPADWEFVERLNRGEKWLTKYTEQYQVSSALLRPTLIYGGAGKNHINTIEKVIRTLRVFPLVGDGSAQRQPVHAEDVATACLQLLNVREVGIKAYNICGGETLSYKTMVQRVFVKLGVKPRFIHLPSSFSQSFLQVMSRIPGLRIFGNRVSDQLQQDLVYSNQQAQQDFCYSARPFQP